jgi:GNAT superfamily N-acetyltransferase
VPSNPELLNDLQFTFYKAGSSHPTVDTDFDEHEFWATKGPIKWEKGTDEPVNNVGVLVVHPKTRRIETVQVAPEFQRQGVATALYDYAGRRLGEPPKHSSDRSDKGDAWAKSVGGPLPRRKKP